MNKRAGFWLLVGVLLLVAVLLLGQVLGLLNYPLAVQLGLQESEQQIGAYGVAVNRAFCVADSLLYLPLTLIALVGLLQRRSWSARAVTAVLAITAYWPLMSLAMLLFLPGMPGYTFQTPSSYWTLLSVVGGCSAFGLVALLRSGDQVLE